MGSKSSPPPVDFAGTAAAQGAANKETAIAQSIMNNPNMVTPYGNQTYTMGADGRPIMTQTLSPAEQGKLNSSNQIQQGSLDILNKDMPNISNALSGPFGMAGAATPGDFSKIGTTATNLGNIGRVQTGLGWDEGNQQLGTMLAQYQKGAQFLDPQWKQTESDTTAQLANQGIVPGTEAYDRAMNNQARQKMGAYSDLIQNSVLSGNQENQAQFGRQLGSGQFANSAQQQQLANAMGQYNANNQGVAQNASLQQMISTLANNARGQNYQEYSTNRTMPINMLTALLSNSQVNNPTFQPTQGTTIAPPPLLQGAQLQGQQNAATASANSAGQGQLMGLGGTLAMAAATF